MEKILDIHHHVIGGKNPQGAVLPEWNMKIDVETMTKIGIGGVLLSLPVASTPEVTRKINDSLAQFAAYNPAKYGILACLPSTTPDAALKEIEYAYDTLKADGFIMPSNAGGLYLGDDRMDEILAELDHRSAVVLFPTKPSAVDESLCVKDLSIYEFPFDTTRAVIDLIYRGKIQKYPNIKWIISHAGGTIPFLAYRLSKVAEENHASYLSASEIIDSLKTLYYDVALSTSPYALSSLKELVGASHIIFGTDAPLRPAAGVAESIAELKGFGGFNKEEQNEILFGTARTLFPRFKNLK